ncbi:MAG: glycoside hydrolase family 15 protein, partial [Gemmatimonadales bacterium]|nr:glycoside hydrolase family 15 protein [Gemmatimonadales bacterium]
MMMSLDEEAYPPIGDYALIGDCHGSALISRQGSVDWCCLGRFDADPVFCRLLDAGKGGFLSVRPEDAYQVVRGYLDGTNILCTTFSTQSGKVALTDFMPVGRAPGAGLHDYVNLHAPFWLVRIVECLEGSARVRVRYRPAVDFARRRPHLTQMRGAYVVEDGPCLHTDVTLSVSGDLAEGILELHAGERRHLLLSSHSVGELELAERAGRMLGITRAFWEEWSAYCRYRGPYREAVLRSALALKLLIYAPTGAIVAAPTTSLPEQLGGGRNWDYRYCWLRDSSFTLYALAALGYSGEARKFARFLHNSCKATHPRVQIMYGIGGEKELTEKTLDHLEGYRGSRPVHTGNGAYSQQQIDVYGEVLDWALLHRTLGGSFDAEDAEFLRSMAEYLTAHWQEPDQGIWEMRGPPLHHVYGKIMSWVGIDRVIRIFGSRKELADVREKIVRMVLEKGVSPEGGHLLQAFGQPGTDAVLLLTPALGFPVDEHTLKATIDAIQRELQTGDYLLRYRREDGLEGEEGAFLICSFWLVDALLMTGRPEEARERYERLLSLANDVGLFAEEIDPKT